jgi:putative transposase
MVTKRGSHCVYDTKYRKWILRGEIRDRVKELFREIAEYHGFEIEEMEVAKNHVHIFISFPPKYSISKVVGILQAVSAR